MKIDCAGEGLKIRGGGKEVYASAACMLAEFDEIPFAIQDALAEGARLIPGDAPRLEAEVLLAHVLGQPRAWLLARPEISLVPDQRTAFDSSVARLASGEPLAYITGHRGFFGLDFLVNPDVLVPRPETELLVEYALRSTQNVSRAADIGAGAGCIAVSLAASLPGSKIVATDISAAALAVAQANAVRHGVADQMEFFQGDLLEPLAGPVDLLCANLPYIDPDELTTLPVARHEPRRSLDGGARGLELIERLLADAPGHMNPGGVVLLEIGATQGEAATALARAAFPDAAIEIRKDLAALDRLLTIHLPRP